MKKNKAEIIFIVDRSGSMSGIREDMEGGIKEFLKEQRKVKGECYVSAYQFDTEYDTVFSYIEINHAPEIIIVPRGSTALHDAVGKTINSIGERLKNTPENERPDTVIFVVVTDGLENASREFRGDEVKKMVEHQTSVYNWKFIYLGSNQDAVLEGSKTGFIAGNSLTYTGTKVGISNAMSAASKASSFYRSSIDKCTAFNFSQQDRDEALDDKKAKTKNTKKS